MSSQFNNNYDEKDEIDHLIDPLSDKVVPLETKEYNGNSGKFGFEENKAFLHLDTIIETISFSRHHLFTLLVCILSNICGAYATSYYVFNKSLLMRKYTWSTLEYSFIFILQNIFGAIGAFISVTSTTLEWDIKSNVFIGWIGWISLVLLQYFNAYPMIIILWIIFNYCQGFINNICCNFLWEEFKLKYREAAFWFANAFKVFGNLFFGICAYVTFDVQNNTNPISNISALICIQLLWVICWYYFTDSPRLMYYNNEIEQLYKYIEATWTTDAKPFKKKLISRIKSTKSEIENTYEKQEYQGIIKHFVDLWEEPYWSNSYKSIAFVLLSSFLMSNWKDSYSYYVNDKSEYLFIIDEDNAPHYRICIYYTFVIIMVFLLISFKVLVSISRFVFCLLLLGLDIVIMILMLIFTKQYLFFLNAFEAVSMVYHWMVYMYFSTMITTQLRNSMTSLLYISLSASYIWQTILLSSLENYTVFCYINFIVAGFWGWLEYLWIDKDTSALKCQEIEMMWIHLKSVRRRRD